jgi:hypothetical protein
LYILKFEIFFIKAKQKVGYSKVYGLCIKAMMKTTVFYEVFLFRIGVFAPLYVGGLAAKFCYNIWFTFVKTTPSNVIKLRDEAVGFSLPLSADRLVETEFVYRFIAPTSTSC